MTDTNDAIRLNEQKFDGAERDRQIVLRFRKLGSNTQRLSFIYGATETEARAILNAACGEVNPFIRGLAQAQLENLAARARFAAVAKEISAREK